MSQGSNSGGKSRHLLIVLGMHRSGTSALCAALQACGGSFGSVLLDPINGINDEGFWEDTGVVAVNEALLGQVDARWYSVAADYRAIDWSSPAFQAQREQAIGVLLRGFGGGPVEVIKDPRLCLTLPFWQLLCAELGITTSVRVISRAPIEVARSLEKRDHFPLGYGLRLFSCYRHALAHNATPDTVYITYRQLLEDPAAAMHAVCAGLPLPVAATTLETAVRRDLRHHDGSDSQGLLCEADQGDVDLEQLDALIASSYPTAQSMEALAAGMVSRGLELTRIGESHSEVLATLEQRDREMDTLAAEHRQALATIAERDEQIVGFDTQLAETGAHLGKALATLDERDSQIAHFVEREEQLERVLNTPGLGLLFRAMWKHERR